ncbi:MAG: hypothetical protein E7376_03765 [Clostridiales bacterium]|nr:hypothetical protein [Clostridiales bacterium]
MENYNNVIYSSISYRRNIKDVPFIKTLTDTELAIGITRSLSEIIGDDFEFKSLKNMPLEDCLKLEEKETITQNLIDNKDISAYGKNDDGTFIYINEEDQIRIVNRLQGFNLEECYKNVNILDDKILDKLEMAFNTNYGFLTANPILCGTGMEVECLLFVPALAQAEKLKKIEKELLKDEFVFLSINNKELNYNCPFIKIKNKYTYGYKENEFAEKIKHIIEKILEIEQLEENNIFEFSASNLVDKIYRNFGIAKNAYRLNLNEALNLLGYIFWGINLKMLKSKKKFDVLNIFNKLKEKHLSKDNLNVKEIEKIRAKTLANMLEFVIKGEVDV